MSLIEIFLTLLQLAFFFIVVGILGHFFIVRQDDEEYYDEDAYMQSIDFSEFYPQSDEDAKRANERDWL